MWWEHQIEVAGAGGEGGGARSKLALEQTGERKKVGFSRLCMGFCGCV